MLARRAPRELEDGHVRAPDEKQKRDRPEQQGQRGSETLHKLFIEALYANAKLLGEMSRGLLGELLEHTLQLGIGRGVSDPWLQSDECTVSGVGVVGDLQREVHVGIVPGEAGRKDADDSVVLV